MVGAAIALVIGAVLVTMMLTGGKLWNSSEASVEAQEEARRALTNMSRELREAAPTTVTVFGGGSVIVFQVVLGINPGGTCPTTGVVCNGARDVNGLPNQGGQIEYLLNPGVPGQLLRQVFLVGGATPPPNQVLATRVTVVNFTTEGSPLKVVNATLTTQAQESGGVQHRVLNATTRIRLRNAPP